MALFEKIRNSLKSDTAYIIGFLYRNLSRLRSPEDPQSGKITVRRHAI